MKFAAKTALTMVKIVCFLGVMITSSNCNNLSTSAGCNDESAKPWKPPWSENRQDLYCYNICFEKGAAENCCSCNSCSTWEGHEIDLYIEDLSVTGQNIVLSDNQYEESKVYKIYRSYSEMKEFPANLCKDINNTDRGDSFTLFSNISEYRDRIVLINFEFNEIEVIDNISCLYKLDELNLRYNRISFLLNTSLANLSYLRILRLEGNKLTTIGPNTLSSINAHILYADISENHIKTLDVTNMFSLFPFCEINFESNAITEFVNEDGFILNTSRIYGPGFLNLRNSSIQHFPDLKTLLNINELSILGKAWEFGFDLRGIPIKCNCALHPFLSLAQDIIESLWRDYFEVRCATPEHLEGELIPNLDLSTLVCQLDADSGCQSPQCTCVDEPNQNTLFVDCSNAMPSLQYFPSVPFSSYSTNISLNLSGNYIKSIPNEPYLSKLSVLDLSYNDIREINDIVARSLEEAVIDLRKNDRLLRLPQYFQYRNACSVIIDDMVIDCDCDSKWIAEWLELKACKSGQFYCSVPEKGIIAASSFNTDELECASPDVVIVVISIIIGGLIALSIVLGFILFKFRYEVLIIYLRFKKTCAKKNITHPDVKHDVYVSLDENNDDVLSWVNKHLLKYLTSLGYKVFIPYQDLDFGSVRGDQVIHAIEHSHTVLVILSNDHFQETDNERSITEVEWKQGWNNFRNNRCKSIVIVNFDHIPSGEISHAQVKAFLRVGYCVNFRNDDRNIMNRIRVKLGEPHMKINERLVKLDKPHADLGEPHVKLGESNVKLGERYSKLSVANLKLGQIITQVNYGLTNVNLCEQKVKLGELSAKLGEHEIKQGACITIKDENAAKRINVRENSCSSLSVVELEFD